MQAPSSSNEALPPAAEAAGGEALEEGEKKQRQKRHQVGLAMKGQRIRIHPTPGQAALLRQWIGAGRFVWNWALAQQNEQFEASGKQLSTQALSKALTVQRQTEALAWLGEVPRTVLSQSFRRLDQTWTNFFDGCKGKRPDLPGKPRFRARGGSRESATFQCDARHSVPFRWKTEAGEMSASNQAESFPRAAELRIPGLGWVEAWASEDVLGEVSSITVKQEGNDWYAALSLINIDPALLIRDTGKKRLKRFDFPNDDPTCLVANPERVGLATMDASVKFGAVATRDGKTAAPLFTQRLLEAAARSEEKRKKFQQAQARKHAVAMDAAGYKKNPDGTWPKRCPKKAPKSKREEAVQRKLSDLSLHDLFRKQDAIHKFTTDLVMNHHTIVVETLVLAAMAQQWSRGFRKKMHEACMGEIIRQLTYKCEWYGRTLIFADPYFPSSQLCSTPGCSHRNHALKTTDTAWVCPSCGVHHERDSNAAFNLWHEGWRLLEQVFQQNDATSLAAGSVVRGSQGIIAQGPEKQIRPRAKARKSTSPFLKPQRVAA